MVFEFDERSETAQVNMELLYYYYFFLNLIRTNGSERMNVSFTCI